MRLSIKILVVEFIAGFLIGFCSAQTVPVAPTLPSNVYGLGVSYNNGAKPSMSGTLTYSHLLSSGSGATGPCANIVTLCYGYTVLDILPQSFNPSVITTNIGVGVAQKALTISGVNFFIPASVGPTITGSNVGWNWTGGVLADYNVKKNGNATSWHIEPNVRFVNATVNGVSNGYQLIFGAQIAFAQ
jgi:hypothetical protein